MFDFEENYIGELQILLQATVRPSGCGGDKLWTEEVEALDNKFRVRIATGESTGDWSAWRVKKQTARQEAAYNTLVLLTSSSFTSV